PARSRPACSGSTLCLPLLSRGIPSYLSHPSSLFFFYCYGAHRDLHSFPTRRSSDLVGVYVPAGDGKALADTLTDLAGKPELVREDRKSTRLNSSHGSISYAVFCLKKKKSTTTTGANKAPRAHADTQETRGKRTKQNQ